MEKNSQCATAAVTAADFRIETLGACEFSSPVKPEECVEDTARVSYLTDPAAIAAALAGGGELPAFEAAGPRRRLFHAAADSRAAIVTCGGLCPGINDVIKALVNTLWMAYGVRSILGIPYGYAGLASSACGNPVALEPETVDAIHEDGGSVLGTSRGHQDTGTIVDRLQTMGINLLFTIGGDGTQRGTRDIAEEAARRGLKISVVGIPKTIDNDLGFTERTFGFETAVYAAAEVITGAHVEAKGALNGIGLVKLMGRDSGFIAATASLANSVVNFCLVPEVPFELDGPRGLLAALEKRFRHKQHAVIVVAEGAGQHLIPARELKKDASGNILHQDIGPFLQERIKAHLKSRGIEHSIKYFDPSYLVRSVPARGTDAVYCLHLAENAVHAAMAGKTAMVVGSWADSFVHVPVRLATRERRKINPCGQLWRSVLMSTGQEYYLAAAPN